MSGTEKHDIVYMTLRLEDVKHITFPLVIRNCQDCGKQVVIHGKFEQLADECKGIACTRCIYEATGKDVAQLIIENAENMMKILKKEDL